MIEKSRTKMMHSKTGSHYCWSSKVETLSIGLSLKDIKLLSSCLKRGVWNDVRLSKPMVLNSSLLLVWRNEGAIAKAQKSPWLPSTYLIIQLIRSARRTTGAEILATFVWWTEMLCEWCWYWWNDLMIFSHQNSNSNIQVYAAQGRRVSYLV